MSGIIIADASPLIALACIDRLQLLQQMYQRVVIPSAVKDELRIESDMPGAKALREALSKGWIGVVASSPKTEAKRELMQLLDEGETEAILLAESIQYRFLLIDERKGRDIAIQRGITIAGTGAILLAAKKSNLIQSVRKELECLKRIGYRLSPKLMNKLLSLAKE